MESVCGPAGLRKSFMLKRVPTGVAGLDPMIQGGFLERSLVLVAGPPGSGKTSMCCKYLEAGASMYNEKGLYVSLIESKEALLANLLQHFGKHFSDLEECGMIHILAFPSMKGEGLPTMMDSIMATIKDVGVKRLVIDSITALSQSFTNEYESRIFTHTVLTKLVPSYGCTTLITKELQSDKDYIGNSAEDFIADGVFLLKRSDYHGRTLRELVFAKLRGTRVVSSVIPFTLEEGFTAFPPFHHKAFQHMRRLKRVPDSDSHFSTGLRSLDEILGRGYPRGSLVLLEVAEAVAFSAYGVIVHSIIANLLNNGSPSVGVCSLGIDPAGSYERLAISAGENVKYTRIAEKWSKAEGDVKPYSVLLKGETPEERLAEYLAIGASLRKETGKPVIWWVALDHFVDIFGVEYAERALSQLSIDVIRHRELAHILAKPGYEYLVGTVGNMAATHLRILDRCGSILVYGVKPRTPIYDMSLDPEKGLSSAKFTPIL